MFHRFYLTFSADRPKFDFKKSKDDHKEETKKEL